VKKKKYTYKKIIQTGLLMVLGGFLVGCTNDPTEEQASGSALNMVSFTRSATPFTVTDDYSPIGVFLVGNGTNGLETQSGRFIYRSGENIWKSSIEVTPNRNYAIFGYAPADAVSASLSNESLSGATLTFSNLPAVSSQDICFVVGVQPLDNKTVAKNIPLGKFAFTGKSEDNYVNLLMDHVYAAICIQMTIDSDYALLRSIKIRKMELQTTTSTVTAAIVLASNTTGSSPVQSATYSNLTGTHSSATFFDSTEGVALETTALTEATCCFAPNLNNSLTLVTTYDVYDRNNNKISERTATNKLPSLSATRGQRVSLNLTIAPTYLYVLSDPDLDNPTITIGN
jgi:hypothetical protein